MRLTSFLVQDLNTGLEDVRILLVAGAPSLSETDKQNALLLRCSFLYLKHLFRSNPNQDNLYLRIIKGKKMSWLLRQFALNFPAVRVGRVNVFQLRGGAVTFWQSHMQMLLH